MENKLMRILVYFTLLSVGLSAFFWGIFVAQGFLAPLVVAILLMMVVLPISKWFEKKGIQRGWASFLSTLSILLFFVIISGIVGLQVKKFSGDWPEIKERLKPNIEQAQNFVEENTGMKMQIPQFLEDSEGESDKKENTNEEGDPEANEEDSSENGSDSAPKSGAPEQEAGSSSGEQGGGSMLQTAGGYAMSFFGFLGTFLLTFIYVFFFLLYRKKFKTSILKMAADHNRDETREIISESLNIAQHYLLGRLLLILFLAIIYTIGLTISGVEQAILISVLAAALSLMPFIGNMVGYGLAVIMAFVSGSGMTGVLGVTITFAIAQFIESYILEPYVVGEKVNINPVFTIIVVVLGGAVWGIMGMLVAIPVLGIIKVVFDHIPVLEPIGYLLGEENKGDDDEDEEGFFKKIKIWVSDKFSKGGS